MPEQGPQRKWKERHTVCRDKIPYRYATDARRVIAKMLTKDKEHHAEAVLKAKENHEPSPVREKKKGLLQVYRCTQCGWFHIGHLIPQPLVPMRKELKDGAE